MENPTCHFNDIGSKNGDPETQGVVKDDSDPAKRIRWEIVLGRGHFSLYREKFPEKRIQKISHIQIGLAVAITILQILNMCLVRYYTSVESTGVGIWSSVSVVLAAVFSLKTSRQLTFRRLCACMGLQILASIFTLVLVILVMSNSIPSQKYRIFDSYYSRYNNYNYDGPVEVLVTCLVFTGFLALASLSQLVLCIYVTFKSASAMCTKTCKFEFKTLPMDEEGGVNSQQNKYGLGLNRQKPPAYADISLEAHKMLSSSCPEI